MSVPVFPLDVPNVDFNSNASVAFAVNENQFGDGYGQRSASGLNNVRETWNASWTNLYDVEADTLIAFFKARGGWEAFYWTAPGDPAPKLWTCRDARKTPVYGNGWTVTATLREEFDLVA